jgi:hypothetical protein
MESYNPYAPPKASDDDGGKPRRRKKKSKYRGDAAIDEAIDRLNEFLSDPANVAADRQARGARVRPVTIVMLVLAALGVITGVVVLAGKPSRSDEIIWILAFALGGVFALIGIIALVLDLKTVPRDEPAPPEAALKGFYSSLRFGRAGYAFTCLCPTAREQTVQAPELDPVVTGPGSYEMSSPAGMKAYAQTFATPGHNQMRLMKIKRVTPESIEGDVARVTVEIEFQSWPRWIIFVAIPIFILIRLVGAIAYAVLYYTTRKVKTVEFTKTLIRGSNGVYYLLDPHVVEGDAS